MLTTVLIMEQIQQLIEILKSTPEMALWGISIYFLFILLKLASWVLALKLIFTQLIKRFFDYKETLLNNEKERLLTELEIKQQELQNKIEIQKTDEFHKVLEDNIYGDKTQVLKLLMSINKGKRLHSSDIDKAIVVLTQFSEK
jgi:hypothetical protein